MLRAVPGLQDDGARQMSYHRCYVIGLGELVSPALRAEAEREPGSRALRFTVAASARLIETLTTEAGAIVVADGDRVLRVPASPGYFAVHVVADYLRATRALQRTPERLGADAYAD
jgi:hypothetical protein